MYFVDLEKYAFAHVLCLATFKHNLEVEYAKTAQKKRFSREIKSDVRSSSSRSSGALKVFLCGASGETHFDRRRERLSKQEHFGHLQPESTGLKHYLWNARRTVATSHRGFRFPQTLSPLTQIFVIRLMKPITVSQK